MGLFLVRFREAAFFWKCLLWFACSLFTHSTVCGTRPGTNGAKGKKQNHNLWGTNTKFQRPLDSMFTLKEQGPLLITGHWSALCHWNDALYFCGFGAVQASMLWTRAQECFEGHLVLASNSQKLHRQDCARCRSLQPAEFSSSLCPHKCPPGPPTTPSSQQHTPSMS